MKKHFLLLVLSLLIGDELSFAGPVGDVASSSAALVDTDYYNLYARRRNRRRGGRHRRRHYSKKISAKPKKTISLGEHAEQQVHRMQSARPKKQRQKNDIKIAADKHKALSRKNRRKNREKQVISQLKQQFRAGRGVNDPINDKGDTLLHSAARAGYCKVAVFLLEKGADPTEKNDDRLSPSKVALRKGNMKMVELLQKEIRHPRKRK